MGIPTTKRARFFAVRADEGARDALKRRGEPLIKGIVHCLTMSVVVSACTLDVRSPSVSRAKPRGGRAKLACS